MELFLRKHLDQVKQNGLQRELQINQGIDFYSNDYLGFACDQQLQQNILNRLQSHKHNIFSGATGSRLLSGHHELFEDIERKLSVFSKTQSSTFIPSGYQANIALISSVCRKGDMIFSDEFNHASIIDGIRLSHAEKEVFLHNSLNDLEEKLSKHKNIKGSKFIICESIYSMEGDHAPLKEISKLAERYDALLIVDESHATGLYASNGSGLVNHLGIREHVFCTIHTAGKALGTSGAWVAGPTLLKEYLVNFSRAFIFSTAPSPIQFIILDEALSFLKSSLHRSEKVLKRADYLRNQLRIKLEKTEIIVMGNKTAIIPIVFKGNEVVLNISKELKKKNINIPAIRPPTVKVGSSRLRLTINYLNCDNNLNMISNLLPKIIRNYI